MPTLTAIPFSPARHGLARRLMTAIVVFIAAFSWSPLLSAFVPLSPTLLFLSAALAYTALYGFECRINTLALFSGLLLLASAAAMLVASQSATLFARLIPLPLLILSAAHASDDRDMQSRLCTALTGIMLVGVIGAIIGFFYAYFGGMPLFSIVNPDGRGNQFYLTTMTNFWYAGTIRPCFIYDEPGAFSFALCSTVLIRELLGRSPKLSYTLMLGGLITLSISHLIATMLYLGFRAGVSKTLVVLAISLAILVPMLQENQQLAFFVDRFSIEDGQLAGDNRTEQIQNFFRVVTPSVVALGDAACHSRPERRCAEHGDITSSPVTPTYRGGIVLLIVQLALHLAIVVACFKGRTHAFAGILLTVLLLQRPYFSEIGYGFLVFFILFTMWQKRAHGRRTAR